MKHYHVVAAVVCREHRYLCMQKGQTRFEYTTLKYEFPGGKIELGETPEEALRRELMEEMDYPVTVGAHLVSVHHAYPDFEITLEAYLCHAEQDDFTLNEHHAFCWLPAERLHELDWAAADIGIVEALTEKYKIAEQTKGENSK